MGAWNALTRRWIAVTNTTWGNSTILAMSSCSILHLRQAKMDKTTSIFPFFCTAAPNITKDQCQVMLEALRVYPESYAALFLTYLNGIGIRASSGASRLVIPRMALILIQASLDSVRRS